MAEQSLITQWLQRIDTKLDRIVERSLTRDEFDKYKLSAQREHDQMKLQIEKLRERAQEREDEARQNVMKWRLFWAGLILTPIVTVLVTQMIMRGGS